MSESTTRAATGAEIDEAFERGDDMRHYFDLASATVETPPVELRPINLTLPSWLLADMDAEAARRGTSRSSVAKNWLVDRADAERERRARRAATA